MTDEAERPVVVVVNTGSTGEAETIGARLVADRLAAGVNIIPGILSLYRWQDESVRAREATMVVRTVRALADRVVARVGELHSCEVPSVLVLPAEGGNRAYLDWIARSVDGSGPDR